jgi:hypothetical protein
VCTRIFCCVDEEQVEVAWEPEPMFDIDSGLSARELDVIEDRLSVIRTWIKFMGLGELEVLFFLRLGRTSYVVLCGVRMYFLLLSWPVARAVV